MTLRHLSIFKTVCELGSITATADKLDMSQPAVSIAIRELEAFYDTKLFERMNRQIYITETGNLLRQYTDTIFHGEVIAILHPYQFAIGEQAAKEIMEVYDYEWTDEEI